MGVPTLEDAGRKLAALMSSRPEVMAAYVFGSVASGRARPDSDTDIGILLDPAFAKQIPLKYRMELITDAGAALGTFDVDVVILNDAPPALIHNVITKGKRVYEKSRSTRVAFEVRNLNLFMDLQPLYKVHLDGLKRRYSRDHSSG